VEKLAKILYSSSELHIAIQDVLSDPKPGDTRIVLVAFVGRSAEAFLPDPKGLKIACWLKPGATDALTLDRLKKRGAEIFKSERLHMKVYWSNRSGCVICSANASGLALGAGFQKEAGVLLRPGDVDIDRLWNYAAPIAIESTDLKRLNKQNGRLGRHYDSNDSTESMPGFTEWRQFEGRGDWKLCS
jgi:hypothetical protein